MSVAQPNPTASMDTPTEQPTSKFVVFQSLRGLLTLENGTEYEIQQLRPHHTDPADSSSAIWYEGFVVAKSTDRRAHDKIMDNAFAKDGSVPSHRPPESNARPLQLKLNPYPEDKKRPDGKSPDYIGSLLTSEGYFTVFARKQDGKSGLLLAGSVAPHQPKGTEPAPAQLSMPDEPAARGRKAPRTSREPG
jgi:hypothetical protein